MWAPASEGSVSEPVNSQLFPRRCVRYRGCLNLSGLLAILLALSPLCTSDSSSSAGHNSPTFRSPLIAFLCNMQFELGDLGLMGLDVLSFPACQKGQRRPCPLAQSAFHQHHLLAPSRRGPGMSLYAGTYLFSAWPPLPILPSPSPLDPSYL